MDSTEPGEEVFTAEGAEQRKRIRITLHESAIAMQRDRLELGDEASATDEVLAARVAALGFEGDATQVVDLLPLVHVAWSDGTIQKGERAAIIGLLRVRGIPVGKAYQVMLALLEERPSDEYLEESLKVLRELIERGGSVKAQTIVGLCIMVAEAAGGFLGLTNPISKDERAAIEHIAMRLGDSAMQEFQRRLG
ncbi:MAG: hypothetical protein AAF799_20295 [Myxococcota bacterium]